MQFYKLIDKRKDNLTIENLQISLIFIKKKIFSFKNFFFHFRNNLFFIIFLIFNIILNISFYLRIRITAYYKILFKTYDLDLFNYFISS
jgi:hypothetical protein